MFQLLGWCVFWYDLQLHGYTVFLSEDRTALELPETVESLLQLLARYSEAKQLLSSSCDLSTSWNLPVKFWVPMQWIETCLPPASFSEVVNEPAAVGSIPAHVSLKQGFLSYGICPTEKWYVASAREAEHHFLQACGLQYMDQEGYRASWDKVSERDEWINVHQC